ncbi:MAG: type IV secretory system conjugative DNA transfer family protein [Oscillospiraceae bacterium]
MSYENVKNIPIIKNIQQSDGSTKAIEKFNGEAFFNDFVDRITKNPNDVKLVKSTPKFLLGGIGACGLVIAGFLTSRKKLINGKEYGTATWATARAIQHLFAKNIAKKEISAAKKKLHGQALKEKIAEINAKYEDADMLFTDTEKICMYNYELNNNTLIVGGSGSGKTRGFVMPNILQAHSSFVITDPKGEILEKAGHFLTEVKGYKLRILNLDEKSLSDGYNPFHYINKEREGWEERVLSLIETIIVNTNGENKSGGSDPFWDKAERLFLQAVFFATVECFKPEQANMNTVMQLIGMLQIAEENDNLDSDLDYFFGIYRKNFGADNIGCQQYKEFREKASGKTAKSIVISAVARLSPFKVKEIKRIFSYDEMQLEMVGEEKTAIFVIVPPTDKTFNFIAGMMFTQLFQQLQYSALTVHKHDGGRLPVPCRFILDEFANTCIIPNFISILAYARSLGIGIVTILQSLEQIKKMYEKDWGVIIDNNNTLLYLGKVTHMDTLEYLSKLLGKGTFDKESQSRTRGRQSSSSTNSDRFGRELLDAAEIRKLKNDKCLLIVGGKDPFYSKKYNYKRHKNYKYTSDANKDYIFVPRHNDILSMVTHSEIVNAVPSVEEIGFLVSDDPQAAVDFLQDNLETIKIDDISVNDGEDEHFDLAEEILGSSSSEISVLNAAVSLIENITELELEDTLVDDGEDVIDDFEFEDESFDEVEQLKQLQDEAMIVKEELLQFESLLPNEETAN